MKNIIGTLCDTHKLHTVTIMFQTEMTECFCVFLHWTHRGLDMCARGTGDTFEDAVAKALKEMAVRRAPVAEVAHA